MANLDVCVRLLPAPDALQEISVVRRSIRFATHLFAGRVTRPEELPSIALAQHEHSLGAVESVPIFVAFLHVGRPDSLLEDELLLSSAGILEDDLLRVGKLLIVIKEVFAAYRR